MAVPKAEELVATPYRHGTKAKAEAFFMNGMTRAMQRPRSAGAYRFPNDDLLRVQTIREPERRRRRKHRMGNVS